MNNSGLPSKITTIFASGDSSRSTIPETGTSGSTGTIATGAAAMDTGFPPLTRVPISSGGIPPHGEDFQGLLYLITSKLQASDAGAKYPFDSALATSISGYPNGAIVLSSDLAGEWLNTADANSVDPEGTAATSTSWIPLAFTGASAVAISTANVTMTCLAAARPIIILSGALTANRYLYVPAWVKDWIIVNNCTGSYSVIVSTVGGTVTASIASGAISRVYCNGSSITKLQGTAAAYDVGTSGANIPLLSGANTWSATNRFSGSLNLDRYFNIGYNNTTAGTRQIAFFCNGNTTQTSSLVANADGSLTFSGNNLQVGSSSLATTGYSYLPNGMLMQWGTVDYTSNPGEAALSVTFPVAFSTACLNVQLTRKQATGASGDGVANLISQTLTGFSGWLQVIGTDNSALRGFTWMAIGY